MLKLLGVPTIGFRIGMGKVIEAFDSVILTCTVTVARYDDFMGSSDCGLGYLHRAASWQWGNVEGKGV